MPDFDGLDAISDINAVMESIVSQPPVGVGLGSLEQCIAELAVTLGKARSAANRSQQEKSALIEALGSKIDVIGGALQDLFVPDDGSLDEEPPENRVGIQAYAKQVANAFLNPFEALIKSQEAMFGEGLERIGDVFMGSTDPNAPKGYFSQFKDTTQFIFTQLFFDSKTAANNIGAMVWYAVEEVIPAADVELKYLRNMKRALKTVLEGISNLPPSMKPGIPNLWAASQLCEVEGHLRTVAGELQAKSTWNRGEFGKATTKICETAEVLRNGILPIGGREFVKNLTGWNDRQLNALQGMKFLPDVKFRLKLIELTTMNRYLQEQDRHIRTFYKNLQGILDAIASLTRVDLGDVLAILVMILRNHIAVIRADVQAQAQGFLSAQSAQDFSALQSSKKVKVETDARTGQKKLVGTGASAEEISAAKKATTDDVYSYMSQQAANFTALSALCFIFKKIQSVQPVLQKLLDVNNSVMSAILKFVKYVSLEKCGDVEGALAINESLYAFLGVLDERLRGAGPSNAIIADRAKGLLERIEAHEKFVRCIRDKLTQGNKAILIASLAISTRKNILALVSAWKDLRERIRNLDFISIPIDSWSTRNILDTLLKAIQCLVARCNNPSFARILKMAENQFRDQRDSHEIKGIDLSYFDRTPKASGESAMGTRMAAFFRLYQALMEIVNMDLTILCDLNFEKKVDETKRPAPGEGATGVPEGPPTDRGSQLRKEQEEKAAAAGGATPFSTIP